MVSSEVVGDEDAASILDASCLSPFSCAEKSAAPRAG